MDSRKKIISTNCQTVNTPNHLNPFERLREKECLHHANTARHLAGLPRGFTRRWMQKNATFLLSLNYLKTQPRVAKQTDDYDNEILKAA